MDILLIEGNMAPDWHQIGLDWIGLELDQIGKLENYCRNKKLAPDWHRSGSGLAVDCLRISIGLAWIGTGWLRIGSGLAFDWLRIGIRLAWIGMDWLGLAEDWLRIGT